MELSTKLYLVDEEGEKFMGIGVLWLLKAIEESSSLRQAAMKMNISYSKAYGMITRLEQQLKVPVVERHKGGHMREGVHLTSFAKDFLLIYESFQEKVKKEAQGLFSDFLVEFHRLEDKNGNKE